MTALAFFILLVALIEIGALRRTHGDSASYE